MLDLHLDLGLPSRIRAALGAARGCCSLCFMCPRNGRLLDPAAGEMAVAWWCWEV